jgi:hypothetical protein
VTRLEPLDRGIRVEVESDRHTLRMAARGGHPVPIHTPSEDAMRGVVHEHLDATLEVALAERGRNGQVLFEGVGFQAAYEVQGDPRGLRRRLPLTGGDA